MGAVNLSELDQAMAASGLFYARFMDDWVILSSSRWKLRHAIRLVNQLLAKLKVNRRGEAAARLRGYLLQAGRHSQGVIPR